MINNKRCRTCNNNAEMMCAFVSCLCMGASVAVCVSKRYKRRTFHERQVVTSVCYYISQTKTS